MPYNPALNEISLQKYKTILQNKTLIPSRKMLKDNLDQKIAILEDLGYKNLEQLLKDLKNKKKFQFILQESKLEENYLANLKRAINSIIPKPNKFEDFIFLEQNLITQLLDAGIKNTKNLYEKFEEITDIEELGKELKIDIENLKMLINLADISRIQWVNHTFAYVLYASGYGSLEKIQKADYQKLYDAIKSVNSSKQLYKGNIGLNDMKILVECSQIVPLEIKYN